MKNELDITSENITKYKSWKNDWCLFAEQVLKVNLDDEQKEVLRAIQIHKLVAVAAGTARGKDFVAAVAALCFMYLTPVFKDGELIENTKIALTAPTGRQVSNVMYPEITRLWNRAKVLDGRLVSTDIRTDWDEWFLTGFKADDTNQEAWSGFHAVNTMFVATEATGISEMTCTAIEGNLQGNSRFVLIFNPNTSIGYAARAMSSPRWKSFRLDDLNAVNVKAKKIIIPGQVDYEWVKDKVESWCEVIREEEFSESEDDFKWEGKFYRPNDPFRIKVRGRFPKISEDILIPKEWIELAQERWLMIKQLNLMKAVPKRYGVDVAGMGRDSSVICDRMGDFVIKFEKHQSEGRADHMKIANLVDERLNHKDEAFIDTIGEGAGVYSRLIEKGQGHRTYSCKASESAQGLNDVTGIYEFQNMRAYLGWAIRDQLNPANGSTLCLPPGGNLIRECAEIRYFMNEKTGKIQLESKDDIKKRLKASTDEFDALSSTEYPHATSKGMSIQRLSRYLPL